MNSKELAARTADLEATLAKLDLASASKADINALFSDLAALRQENMVQGSKARRRRPDVFAAHKALLPMFARVSDDLRAALDLVS